MDPAFFATQFEPFFLQLAALTFCHKTKTDLPPELKKLYKILQNVIPIANRIRCNPDMKLQETVDDNVPIICLPYLSSEKKEEKEEPKEDSDYEPPDEEDRQKINDMDDKCFIQLKNLRNNRWIAIQCESDDTESNISEDELESVQVEDLQEPNNVENNMQPGLIKEDINDSGNEADSDDSDSDSDSDSKLIDIYANVPDNVLTPTVMSELIELDEDIPKVVNSVMVKLKNDVSDSVQPLKDIQDSVEMIAINSC